jgi:hypothetical protein
MRPSSCVPTTGVPGGTGGCKVVVPDGYVPLVFVPQMPDRPLPRGQRLIDTFYVQNFGEFPAHYQSLGADVEDPYFRHRVYDSAATEADNVLAPGDSAEAVIEVFPFGDGAGVYFAKAGFKSVPASDGEDSYWLTLLWPPVSLTLT